MVDDKSVLEIFGNLPKVIELISNGASLLCFGYIFQIIYVCAYVPLCVSVDICFYIGQCVLCHFDKEEAIVALLKTLSPLKTTEIEYIQETSSRYHKMAWSFLNQGYF